MSARSRSFAVVAGATLAATLALTSCASNSDTTSPGGGSSSSTSTAMSSSASASMSSSASTSAPSGLKSLVPAAIAKRGTLIVGVNVPYAPNEYIQNGKVVGFDVDLVDATAAVLGLKTSYRQADFDKIVPAVQGGTYDVGMSSFTDTKEREKTDDFVTYFSAGILWASQKGKTVDPNKACGLTVAVQSNTTEQQDQLPALSKACTKAGKKAIKVLPFQSQDAATNAVVLGRANAMSADSPVTAYAIKATGGKLQAAGAITEAAPYGWPIKKGSTLVQAMQKALQTLMDNGAYLKICQKWGVQSGAVKKAEINGAIS